MRIHTFGQHIEITPALRSYLMKKLCRLKSRVIVYSDIHVRLERDKDQFKVSALTHFGHRSLHTAASAISAYTAIDGLVVKLNRLVVELKNKQMHRRVRSSPLALNLQ